MSTTIFNRRKALQLSAGIAATATLAACGGGPASTNQVPTTNASGAAAPTSIEATLAYSLSSGFDPMNASSAVGTAANQHIFEGLMDLDPVTRKPYAALAKEEPKVSADGLTWTATLRDGAKWSDGTPVTGDDVAWSFTRALDPANKALMAGFIYFIESAKSTGTNTVEFKLKHPFALFPTRIGAIKIVPKAKTGNADQNKAFDTMPMGSGPFKIDSASKETGIKMSVNDNYNGPKKPKVKTMTWNTTTDNAARVSDLQSGRVQAIEAVPFLNVASLKGQFQVDEVTGFACMFLMFNGSAAPFNDKRVRQALHYAINKENLVKTALQGFGEPATGYLDTGNPNYQAAATSFAYDQNKAKQLLADAGVSNLTFEFATTDVGFIKDCAPLIVQDWKAIGINATLNTQPSSAIYATVVPADSFRVLAASGDPSIFGPDPDLLLRWFYYGTTWPTQRSRTDAASAKQTADLLDSAAKLTDAAAQKTAWKGIYDRVADEANLYPVIHTKVVTASDSKKLAGFKGAPTTGMYFLDANRTA